MGEIMLTLIIASRLSFYWVEEPMTSIIQNDTSKSIIIQAPRL